jgi:hypothetical protein
MELDNNITFGKKIHSFTSGLIYDIYTIDDIKDFLKTVKIWKGLRTKDGKFSIDNREVDEIKVNEIFESIMNDTLTPSIFEISECYDPKDKKISYKCWEGQHRWYALKKFYLEKHTKNISHLFTCHIYKNDNDDNIKVKFTNRNKFTPVPIDSSFEPSIIKMKRIELVKNLVDYLKNTYSELRSTSNNPRKPNFNVDKLFSNLNEFIKENKLENVSFEYFQKKINNHNDQLKIFYEDKYKTEIRPINVEKTFKNNAFLFLLDDFTTSLIV